jgi:hypothetical protein
MFWILVLLFDAALASLHCVKVGLPVYMYVCVTGLSYSRRGCTRPRRSGKEREKEMIVVMEEWEKTGSHDSYGPCQARSRSVFRVR